MRELQKLKVQRIEGFDGFILEVQQINGFDGFIDG